MARRVQVSIFWVMPSSCRRSSPKRRGRSRSAQMTRLLHLLASTSSTVREGQPRRYTSAGWPHPRAGSPSSQRAWTTPPPLRCPWPASPPGRGSSGAAGLTAGQRVLIHGGGGGVGHIAVQIAKAQGAHVITTASAAKRSFLLGLGADDVIDYRAADFTQVAADLDVVFDLVGGGYGERSLRVLRPGGALVTVVDHTNRELARKAEACGALFAGVTVEPDHHALEALAGLADDGLLRVHVGHTFALDDVASAHRLVENGHLTGKVVLIP
jgi:hypothetical protein